MPQIPQETLDAIVVGFGPVGSAVLHRLSLAGRSVLGIPSRPREPIDDIPLVVRVGGTADSEERNLALRTDEIIRGFACETGISLLVDAGGAWVVQPRRYCAVQRALARVREAQLLKTYTESFRGTDSHAWLTTTNGHEYRARHLIICRDSASTSRNDGTEMYARHRFLFEVSGSVPHLELKCGQSTGDIFPVGSALGNMRKYVVEVKTPLTSADAPSDNQREVGERYWSDVQQALLLEGVGNIKLLKLSKGVCPVLVDDGFRIRPHPESSRITFVDDPGRFGSIYGPALGEVIVEAIVARQDVTTALVSGRTV
jgi:glycine/D-amino acid oxidase-like deaminating enzyme